VVGLCRPHHLDHGIKVDAFTAAKFPFRERVIDVSYLLWEWPRDNDVEVVLAKDDEGAAIIELVLEAGEVVSDAVEGAKPQEKP
jgi:hypothetical protein